MYYCLKCQPSRHKTLNHCWFNVNRLRRWTNVKTTMIQRIVSAENVLQQRARVMPIVGPTLDWRRRR